LSQRLQILAPTHVSLASPGVDLNTWHFGQYQGAAVFTGLGLRLWHNAQRYRLPFTAVLGRFCLPLLGKLFTMATSHFFPHAGVRAVAAKVIE
jgi:hypothetical protein